MICLRQEKILRSGTYLGKIPKVFQRVMSRDLPMIF